MTRPTAARSLQGMSEVASDISPPPVHLSVLVVDDEPNIRRLLALSLENDGHHVVSAGTIADAITENARQPFDLAFVDLRLGTGTGLDLIPKLLGQSPWLQIVVITAYASYETAVEATKAGATDYLAKPFTPAQVRLAVERAAKVRALQRKIVSASSDEEDQTVHLESQSAVMRRAVEMAHQVADSEATILMRGESGTGKGVLARAIHRWSARAEAAFSVVSCPALSPQLLESELFGHVKGAFTGAIRDNPGRIALSAGGTLFLDEIGDLPLNLQPKLLRFVQDRQYERVGDTLTRRADVRLITATNVDLQQAVAGGTFREDLLYRVNVIQIDLPPLRERVEDIMAMAEVFLASLLRRGKSIKGFTDEARRALIGYRWPGNLRELRNVIERAAILCRGELIGIEQLPSGLAPTSGAAKGGAMVSLEAIEEEHIRKVLNATRSLDEAAGILGIDVATLYRKRRKYGI